MLISKRSFHMLWVMPHLCLYLGITFDAMKLFKKLSRDTTLVWSSPLFLFAFSDMIWWILNQKQEPKDQGRHGGRDWGVKWTWMIRGWWMVSGVILVKVDHTSFAPSSDSCILSLLTTGSNIKCRHVVPWANSIWAKDDRDPNGPNNNLFRKKTPV